MAKWEGSKADRAVDKAGAKKAGVSAKKWEGSAADRKKDAAARKRKKPASRKRRK
jgi:hypothetical protein